MKLLIFSKSLLRNFRQYESSFDSFLDFAGVLDGFNQNAKFLSISSRTYKIFIALDSNIDDADF